MVKTDDLSVVANRLRLIVTTVHRFSDDCFWQDNTSKLESSPHNHQISSTTCTVCAHDWFA